MGALLEIFRKEHTHQINFFLDFRDIQEPNGGEELDIYNAVKEILDKKDEILNTLTAYEGCNAVIHKAITEPCKENEEAAWDQLIPAVDNLKIMYEYSNQLEEVAPRLLAPLCKVAESEGTLENQTALAKQLCDLFNFVLQFDDKKMTNPHIQNDFSYFRRSMGKLKTANLCKVPEDIANHMSLFYAYPTPLMNKLTSLVKDQDFGISKDDIVLGLSLLANVCLDMVEKGLFDDNQINMFCLRAMTAAIILVDHISDVGVFCRKSPVNIKNAIIILRDKQEDLGTQGLINALKYTTRHLNDQDTPNAIKNLLA